MSAAIEQRNQEATVYVGNLDEKINEELLWELMLQMGPVVNVHIPKDKVSGKHLGYGFVEYRGEEDAEYAMKVMNMIKLYGKPLKINKASQDKKVIDVGANIFIGNLDPEVDEKLLYDTFSAFGGITQTPKLMLDPDTGASKGYGFVSFDSFEASDMAIECMNGQYLCNRPIIVQYAFKKDSPGERHGSQAERILAATQPQKFKPNTIFSTGNGDTTNVHTPQVNAFQTADYQYLQYSNPLMMQQMAMYGMNPLMPMNGGMPPLMNMPGIPPMPGFMNSSMPPPPPPMHGAGFHPPPPPQFQIPIPPPPPML